jgi:hypothetical protein
MTRDRLSSGMEPTKALLRKSVPDRRVAPNGTSGLEDGRRSPGYDLQQRRLI